MTGFESLDEVKAWARAAFPGLAFFPYWDAAGETPIIVLSQIEVPTDIRGQGVGTAVLAALTGFADQVGVIVALTPDPLDTTTSVASLTRFYRRFGFVENEGPAQDARVREAMIRHPRERV